MARRRRHDPDGHGQRPGYQRRVAVLQDGRLQASYCSGCICHVHPACRISRKPVIPPTRHVSAVKLPGPVVKLTLNTTDAPRYTRGLVIAAACTIVGAVVILVWKILYSFFSNGDAGVELRLVDEAPRDGDQC